MSETDSPTPASEPADAASPPAAKPATRAPERAAPRELPSRDELAAWIAGADCPKLAALFDLPLAKFDALWLQIKKEELLPQHWQPFAATTAPADELFDGLPEAGRLRLTYRDQELSRRRLAALRAAWRELRGKQPSLWTVGDLLAALRRLIEKKAAVDLHDLLSAVRDLWAGMTLPHGREQLALLWSCLVFIRDKAK